MQFPLKIISVFLPICLLCSSLSLRGQDQRIKPPKRPSKIESADVFVDHSFDLYHKVFVYDSLTRSGYETTPEQDDIIMESMRSDLDSLWSVAPALIDDLSAKVSFKTGKALINLNKAKKAIKASLKMVKNYLIEEKDEEEKQN